MSRFYRAPEIVLGMPYGYAIDVWAIGCTLFELFTGKILFQGRNNNQMLKAIMQIRGRMHYKYYKHGKMSADHFDDKGNFISMEFDEVTNKACHPSFLSVHGVLLFLHIWRRESKSSRLPRAGCKRCKGPGTMHQHRRPGFPSAMPWVETSVSRPQMRPTQKCPSASSCTLHLTRWWLGNPSGCIQGGQCRPG